MIVRCYELDVGAVVVPTFEGVRVEGGGAWSSLSDCRLFGVGDGVRWSGVYLLSC